MNNDKKMVFIYMSCVDNYYFLNYLYCKYYQWVIFSVSVIQLNYHQRGVETVRCWQFSFGSVWTLLITDTGIDLVLALYKLGFRTGVETKFGNAIVDKFTTRHFCGGNWVASWEQSRIGVAGLGMSDQDFSLGVPVGRNEVCPDTDDELVFVWGDVVS